MPILDTFAIVLPLLFYVVWFANGSRVKTLFVLKMTSLGDVIAAKLSTTLLAISKIFKRTTERQKQSQIVLTKP